MKILSEIYLPMCVQQNVGVTLFSSLPGIFVLKRLSPHATYLVLLAAGSILPGQGYANLPVIIFIFINIFILIMTMIIMSVIAHGHYHE